MPKTFYTERDIEDLHRQGVQSLVVDDNVVLTELGREKAERLGVTLIRDDETPYSAPIRPYISEQTVKKGTAKNVQTASKKDLREQVRTGVIKRLGDELDPVLLDTIITRVLDGVGVKR